MKSTLTYNVATFRAAGLEAKWSRTQRGAPIIIARNPVAQLKHQKEIWWYCDHHMWQRASKVGIVEAFTESTLLGDFFSI